MSSSSSRQQIHTVLTSVPIADGRRAATIGDLGAYSTAKRLFDFVCCLLLIVVLIPVLLVVGLLIRFDSKGPVIFRQPRVGKDGTTFVMYKFRSMVTNAPTLSTEEMKSSGTNYYTKLGLVLRRYSLDELPQLWNVLRGDMSLIGPRPSLLSQNLLNTRRQLYRVQELRPGITGLAQVRGRDSLSDTDKVVFDAEYRANCSLSLDCRIVFLTLRAVFSGIGAQ
jgi:O-antigen biosynthesis protein WbqP